MTSTSHISSAKSGDVDLHLFLEDLKEIIGTNSHVLKKALDLTKDITFLFEEIGKKLNSLADQFSELSRSYLVLSKAKIPEFDEISPSMTDIWTHMKICVFRFSNYFKVPQKVMEKNFKPMLEQFINSEDNIAKLLKKQSGVTKKLSYNVNNSIAVDPNQNNVKIFGERNVRNEIKLKELRLRNLDMRCFSEFLNAHKSDQEDLMRCGINSSVLMLETCRTDYLSIWNDYLESFKEKEKET